MPSQTFRTQTAKSVSDDPTLALLTIDHSSLDAPLLFVNNTENVVSNGETFVAAPFAVTLPGDGDTIKSAKLTIQNIDQEIGETILALSDAATITIQIVLASTPDVIEREWVDIELFNVSVDAFEVTGEFSRRQANTRRFCRSMTPDGFPGVSV